MVVVVVLVLVVLGVLRKVEVLVEREMEAWS